MQPKQTDRWKSNFTKKVLECNKNDKKKCSIYFRTIFHFQFQRLLSTKFLIVVVGFSTRRLWAANKKTEYGTIFYARCESKPGGPTRPQHKKERCWNLIACFHRWPDIVIQTACGVSLRCRNFCEYTRSTLARRTGVATSDKLAG